MSIITLRVNGAPHTVDVEPMTPLLYVLRNDVGVQEPGIIRAIQLVKESGE